MFSCLCLPFALHPSEFLLALNIKTTIKLIKKNIDFQNF